MPETESGITLDFPDNNYFRLEDCDGYKKIQNNFSEMDCCWYDAANDTLYLIELKDWQNNRIDEENKPGTSQDEIYRIKKGISQYRINKLLKKSIDSTCVFMSILLGKPGGKDIQACSPFSITDKTTIKLLSIINWTEADVSYISAINTAYKSKFKSYARLFDIKTFLVMTKEKASETFVWIG